LESRGEGIPRRLLSGVENQMKRRESEIYLVEKNIKSLISFSENPRIICNFATEFQEFQPYFMI
jgi:hypothetical protein